MNSAVVLLSGGQDSTTCLHWALKSGGFDHVEAVSFDYGQRHQIEIQLAKQIAEERRIRWTLLPLSAIGPGHLAAGSLTNPEIENTEGGLPATDGWHAERGLPPSFVPGRNILFFALAAAYGIPRGMKAIVSGVCATDRAGYPDCRSEFVSVMEKTIRVAMDEPNFDILAPLLYRTKADTWQLALDLDVLDLIIHGTHTCYEGNREDFHPWGYGCGSCGACKERRDGFVEFQHELAVNG